MKKFKEITNEEFKADFWQIINEKFREENDINTKRKGLIIDFKLAYNKYLVGLFEADGLNILNSSLSQFYTYVINEKINLNNLDNIINYFLAKGFIFTYGFNYWDMDSYELRLNLGSFKEENNRVNFIGIRIGIIDNKENNLILFKELVRHLIEKYYFEIKDLANIDNIIKEYQNNEKNNIINNMDYKKLLEIVNSLDKDTLRELLKFLPVSSLDNYIPKEDEKTILVRALKL